MILEEYLKGKIIRGRVIAINNSGDSCKVIVPVNDIFIKMTVKINKDYKDNFKLNNIDLKKNIYMINIKC